MSLHVSYALPIENRAEISLLDKDMSLPRNQLGDLDVLYLCVCGA